MLWIIEYKQKWEFTRKGETEILFVPKVLRIDSWSYQIDTKMCTKIVEMEHFDPLYGIDIPSSYIVDWHFEG